MTAGVAVSDDRSGWGGRREPADALVGCRWRVANHLSVARIYLLDDPLLHDPLAIEHLKATAAGPPRDHAGDQPGVAHLNRVIRARDLSLLFVLGPGCGGCSASRKDLEGLTVGPRRTNIVKSRVGRRVSGDLAHD